MTRPAWSLWGRYFFPSEPAPGTQPPFLTLAAQGWPVTRVDEEQVGATLSFLPGSTLFRENPRSQAMGTVSPDLPLTHCVMLAKPLQLSGPQSPHLSNEDIDFCLLRQL